MTMTTTERPQFATPVTLTLGVTNPNPDAIATFLKGVPLDAAFWRRFRYQCDHCQETGTTACGALWRTSLADDCTDLYYLHSRCLSVYRRVHGLRSVEGRLPLVDPAPVPSVPAGTWRTWSVADPEVGAITTLYDPDYRAVAYAVGRDDPALVRVAVRLNGDGAATTEAVQR